MDSEGCRPLFIHLYVNVTKIVKEDEASLRCGEDRVGVWKERRGRRGNDVSLVKF